MGKTSFLNAVKLLFTGFEKTEFRKVGFPAVQLNTSQFVLGDGTRWTGLINREARRRSLTLGEPLDASIQVSWLDGSQEVVTAKRWWVVDAGDFTSGLTVERCNKRLTGTDAQELLEDTIPSELVKFFFFDGEEIKSIAETSGSLQTDFDRLLQITFVENLASELVKLSNERKRVGLEASLQKSLDEASNSVRKAKTVQLEAREKIEELDAQIGLDGIELRRVQIRRANLSSGASEFQKKALEEQRAAISNQLEKIVVDISRELPKDVPILANLALVRRALEAILERLAQRGSAEASYVENVSARLQGWIADGCPTLDEGETIQLAVYLTDKMRKLLRADGTAGLFANVSIATLEHIMGRFEVWSTAGEQLKGNRARLLIEAFRLTNSRRELDDSLFSLEVGANGNAEEFRNVSNRVAELEDGIAKQNQLKGQWTQRLKEAGEEEKRWEAELTRLEGTQDQVSQAAKESRFIQKSAKALNEISQRIKNATRLELEEMLNERFKRIIQHPLVDRIGLDEGYVMTFYEKSGKALGRTSLSSGMKQLAATALLWAMKDSAGADLPVIIDTPLGRIDRENQEHLLRAYYPALSTQVIVLPTNAEIDERKLDILSDKVATHYRIVNDSGDAARIENKPLVGPNGI
jgi:DNA sulfur modification protein DndD